MPLDALCLSGLVSELQASLTGAKIDKVYQPGKEEVVLGLRTKDGNQKLLLSANPGHPRLHITQINRENPEKPPMFCMLLRKYLTGGRILSIEQPHLERVVRISLEVLDELGDRTRRELVLEAMGRHSNLILLDGDGRIVDCLRRVDADMSARRQVLPGLFYHLPPTQEKQDPTQLERADWIRMLGRASEEERVDQWLLANFSGLSPLVCREVSYRACGRVDAWVKELDSQGKSRLLDEVEGVLTAVKERRFVPEMLQIDGKLKDFTFIAIKQYEQDALRISCDSFSEMLDRFYEQRERQESVKQRGQDLIRAVSTARDRTARKIGNQRRELEQTLDRDRLRQMGDLITSNLYRMSRGMEALHAENYYDGNAPVEIPLDPLLTPQQNAARYYKEYNKAKTAQEMLSVQIEKNEMELEYLNSVLENISLSEGERDLQEIRSELVQTGYLRRQGGRGQNKRGLSVPMEFRSSTGLRISVGKNNAQNDLLTCKQAGKQDIWFHTQKIHGAHVILWTQGQQPDLTSLNEAACLAALYSQGRGSSKVPVDFTPVRYVKKPAGSRPGMVIYTTYETAYVTPDEELAKKLRVK